MDMRVDFHMHSTFSDGIETPEQLLTHAIEQGISYMALTDHDEIDGCRVMKAIKQDQVQIITGCEFSSDFRGKDVHILGYDFDPNNKPLRDFLAYFKEKRYERVIKMIELCQANEFMITLEELKSKFPDTEAYGRPHIAQLLIEHGYAQNVQDAFDHILNAKGPCYVPKVKLKVPDVLDIIHQAAGLAILAHPILIRNDTWVEELLDYDFDGIEVYHSKHNTEAEERYLAMAKERHLLVSGGSDYHGINGRTPYHLGEYVVDSEKFNLFMKAIKAY
ncbi:PHP domain-containing protein [Veillonella sp. YH-vei2232]|uniref:PHP domain-containing protein n=1 Tax=Veillonella absiana TaxID=3079305 RepID=A0ABU3Z970_9FIRM|nr:MULTISPECIES: PHP domain-containing protein [unclassified Veillonella]MDV5062859.1 PHP domain-containing protein [Veillonella sp. YH-vei2232]MDV5088468.1 PHP domain-containing protein [Veillonella sp. YH-vei2233]